ncbi:MAG: response regulator [Candidatus Omnitrophica bacterium]|nr:response regulator [Candidatus Omnitrophota bacterium]
MIKLLFVDDEEGITDSVRKFFELRSFCILTALSGEEAIKIIVKDKPDIVFLDIALKDMNGIEVLKRIKEHNKKIKVIMVTGLTDQDTADKARRYGAEGYITKPFLVEALETVVTKKIQELLKERR